MNFQIYAVEALLKTIESIRSESHRSVEISHQIADGGFVLSNAGDGFNQGYQSLQNVIVKVKSEKIRNNDSVAILFNCHFDSVIGSPGGSDDAVNCGIMLNLLEYFATNPELKLMRDVVFLFNGAEEQYLPASHAFVAHHPWAKQVIKLLSTLNSIVFVIYYRK